MRVSAASDPTALPSPRRRRRSTLAALPNPVEQEELAAIGTERARERIRAADEAGRPLTGRNGNRRSPATLPEFRSGRAPANKGRRFPPEVLTKDEVQALIDAQRKTGPTGLRNRALIVVLWRAGLRCAEALALMPHDVSLEAYTVTVLQGKGAKRRVAGIDGGALRYVEAWMQERARMALPPEAPLFCTTTGEPKGMPMHSSTVREMLKHSARKAGITKRVHPHGLRHTHAYELSQEDVPVQLIQAQLGHDDLAMTAHYIDHLNPKQLIDRIGSREYPGDPLPPAPPVTAAAASNGAPVLTSAGPDPRVYADPREPRRSPVPTTSRGRASREIGDANREFVLATIAENGGQATQAQLRRALGLSIPTMLKHLHRLHEEGRIMRGGMDRNHSVIWKTAPPPVVVVTLRSYRQAPRGEGSRRVLDALEALGGRASQAELARLLGLESHTIRGHCVELASSGLIDQGGLDKTTSNRGSQVWRLRSRQARFEREAPFTRALRFPARA